MITPTIGRKVWYWPVGEQNQVTQHDVSVPLDATVIYPWGDTCVSLRVTDHAGQQHVRTSVLLHQGAVEDRPASSCATWMPYQQAVAKKDAAA